MKGGAGFVGEGWCRICLMHIWSKSYPGHMLGTDITIDEKSF